MPIPRRMQKARELGAEGIGLRRTEHMFFRERRINWVRQMVLSALDVKNLKAKIACIEKELARATNNNATILKKELRAG